MRRIPLGLAVTTALVPLVFTLSAGPAQAAGGSLTVTTIGRNGARIVSALHLLNTRTGQSLQVNSNKRLSLANGLWAVLVDIETPDPSPKVMGMTDTIAAVRVSVSGNTALTLDARKGRQVGAAVDAVSAAPAGQYWSLQTAVACPANDLADEAGVYNSPGGIFEIPNPGSSYFHFAWMQSWVSMNSGSGYPTPSSYYVSRETAGLPAVPYASFRKSSLATVGLWMSTGETNKPVDSVRFTPVVGQTSDCANMLYGYSAMYNSEHSNAYVSPGTWQLQGYNGQGVGGQQDVNRSLAAGRSYGQVFGRAVWGPTSGLPVAGNRTISYTPYRTIADGNAGTDGVADTRNTVTLSKGGKVLKSRTVTSSYGTAPVFTAGVNTAGWYGLYVSSTRLQWAALTSRVTQYWHFYANPASPTKVAPGYQTRLLPAGLNQNNSVARGTTTPVTISLSRADEPWAHNGEAFTPESVKSLVVYASHDDGRTWHAVAAHWSAGHWVANVPEPSTAGTVTLRTIVTDTAGNTSTQTVYRAFDVG